MKEPYLLLKHKNKHNKLADFINIDKFEENEIHLN